MNRTIALVLAAAFSVTQLNLQAQSTGTGTFADPHVYQYINGDLGWHSERGQSDPQDTEIRDENGNVLNTEIWGVNQVALYTYYPKQKKKGVFT